MHPASLNNSADWKNVSMWHDIIRAAGLLYVAGFALGIMRVLRRLGLLEQRQRFGRRFWVGVVVILFASGRLWPLTPRNLLRGICA